MITIKNLNKSFGVPPIKILHDVNLEIPDGSFVSITGRSGSGKSTLLYSMSSLDEPTSGSVIIDGRDLTKVSSKELHQFRNLEMGFVFQFHYLLPELTALENVLVPAMKSNKTEFKKKLAIELLQKFGIGDKTNRLPKELSGGEQQRVAIARALIMGPKYIFADEPTGNLDSVNGEIVMKILKEITDNKITSVIYVTHDVDFAAQASMQIQLVDGRITSSS